MAIDYFTKWSKAYAVPKHSSVSTVDKLHSDQQQNIKAQVVCLVCKRLGIMETSNNHPKAMGWLSCLIAQLAILATHDQHSWGCHLPGLGVLPYL